MTVSRAKLAALVAGRLADPALIALFLADLEPLLAAIDTGELPLATGDTLDADALAAALLAATGQTETHFVLDISSRDEPLDDPYLSPDGYVCTLTTALARHRRAAYNAAYGKTTIDALIDPIWDILGREYQDAFNKSCQGFVLEAGADLYQSVACGALVTIAYAAGYVLVGDRAQYEQLRPLLRLLPCTVPIGIPADETSLWLTLVQ